MQKEKSMNEIKMVSVRLIEEAPYLSKTGITNAKSAARLVQDMLKGYDREVTIAMNLNASKRPINMSIISVGALNYAVCPPREFFKTAILSNAESVILFHNHPSGNVEPSNADIELTDRLVKCGKLLDINVTDSIVVGPGKSYHSMYMNETVSFNYEPSLSVREQDISWHQADPDFLEKMIYVECSIKQADSKIGYFDPPNSLWTLPGMERYRLMQINRDGTTQPYPDDSTYFQNQEQIEQELFEQEEKKEQISLVTYEKAMKIKAERQQNAEGRPKQKSMEEKEQGGFKQWKR